MKKIIFINQETGPLMIDIVNVFVKKEYSVSLYAGEVISSYALLDDNVNLKKLIKYNKSNNFYRIFTWVIFFLQSLFFLTIDLSKNTKVYFSSNPPFIHFLIFLFRNNTFIHIYDVYPNALLALSYIKKTSFIYRFFSYLNKSTFSKAKLIFAPSNGMKEMLTEYVDINKIKIISWWANTEFITPINKKDNKFITKYNLADKFIVMYSGNFGITHNIEKILKTALLLKNKNDILFVIIGNGPKKKVVDSFQEKNNLDNLLILPFQDASMLPYSLTAADISIVLDSFSKNSNNESTASIPSKMFYLMSSGSVIYAEADNKSELNRLIQQYDLGICDSSRDTENLINFIKFCINNNDKFVKYKENSRNASFNFSKENAQLFYNEINIE